VSGKLISHRRHRFARSHKHVTASDIDLILQRDENRVASSGFR
jgi:hypothetical protein